MFRSTPVIVLFASALSLPAAPPDKHQDPPLKTVPPDAVANPDGTWNWTDKNGKHWLLKKSPVGIMKLAPADASTTPPKGVPQGAVRQADGSFLWADKNGKKWVYRMTPFGLSRTEFVEPGSAPQPMSKSENPQ